MRFRVLGPLRAEAAGSVLDVRVGMLRRLLAVLLSRSGSPLSVAELVDALWPDGPPPNAVKTTQVYVHRLRRLLGTPDSILWSPSGYAIALSPGALDSEDFAEGVDQARRARASGDVEAAFVGLGRTLDLWRGTPYLDVPDCPFLQPEVERLSQLRIRALAERTAIGLDLGRHLELVPELAGLVAEHPYQETFAAQLMLALYRSGRQADALEAFRRTRSVLVDELGIEPGPDLSHLHEAVLRCDPALDVPRPGAAAEESARIVPAQLPPALATLTGRKAELDKLLSPSIQESDAAGAVVISAIDGMAGIGKTALAVYAAHRLAERYPDGQLFLDLHGFTQGIDPVPPTSALDRMLRSVGVPSERIPSDLDERSALWRTQVAGKRVLVVLDNAASEEQVRPLLPGSPGCLALVTSRHRLAGLDQAQPLSLDVLPPHESVALFTTVVGQTRLDCVYPAPGGCAATGPPRSHEPVELLSEIVSACGHLPLAIRLVAARLRDRPGWTLAYLADRLRDERTRLVELEVGRRSVAGALQLSYDHLDAESQRLFRFLGLHPGPDFDTWAAAALAEVGIGGAERAVETLVDAHLLESPVDGRYRFHDLIREYAVHLASRDEPDDQRRTAIGRLLDFYLSTTSKAMEVYAPWDKARRPTVPPVATPCPSFADDRAGVRWLETERANLVASAGRAVECGLYRQAGDLSLCAYRFFESRSYPEELRLDRYGLEAMRALGDRDGEGRLLANLGTAHNGFGDRPAALTYFYQALECFRQSGNQHFQAIALSSIAHTLFGMGDYAKVTDYCDQARLLYRQNGDVHGEVRTLETLGYFNETMGRYEAALTALDEGLELARSIDAPYFEGNVLHLIGWVHYRTGDFQRALEAFQQALTSHREASKPLNEIIDLSGVGRALCALDRPTEALDHQRKALQLALRAGYGNGEFEARHGLGETLRVTGQLDASLNELQTALGLARELHQRHDRARAHDALGWTYRELGDLARAREHWQQALQIYRDLGVPDAETVDRELATIQATQA